MYSDGVDYELVKCEELNISFVATHGGDTPIDFGMSHPFLV